MKKITVIAAIAVLFIVFLGSCKTHEKCPAYTKAPNIHNQALTKNS